MNISFAKDALTQVVNTSSLPTFHSSNSAQPVSIRPSIINLSNDVPILHPATNAPTESTTSNSTATSSQFSNTSTTILAPGSSSSSSNHNSPQAPSSQAP
ncbi:hypothetical protein LIER_37876 [Lithospermum erythrorhizon]|uniref:Uncharacterized protein n=1 Tax=Lithospermum erythrorhizon TaxID=34254 RepID=A0AAV3PT47_LITER